MRTDRTRIRKEDKKGKGKKRKKNNKNTGTVVKTVDIVIQVWVTRLAFPLICHKTFRKILITLSCQSIKQGTYLTVFS